ncbi:MAG: hypothetical protein AMS18_15425 [Gemmatimonas sp. SG8_17]|nr:MAG: hypothetical protein AMS18_15425 [Gemmatimonas sp. SG8_17]
MNAGIKLAVVLLVVPNLLSAQGFLEQFSYEGLRFSGVGFEFGGTVSDRLTGEFSGAVRVDCGPIAPRVRVLIGASYFKGDFDSTQVAEFENNLARIVDDPTNDFTIDVGGVAWSDLAIELDLQYVIGIGAQVASFVGVGLAAHLMNGSGESIGGTFVEDALDRMDLGLNLSLGTHVQLVQSVYLTMDVRGSLATELRSAAARAGLMYRIP